MNFLEQLVAEWYKYQDYLVFTNIRFGPRRKGWYEGEMDVVAFHPKDKMLYHIETTSEASPKSKLKEKIQKKFKSAEKHYNEKFSVLGYQEIKKIVIATGTGKKSFRIDDEIEVFHISKMINEINVKMKELSKKSHAVPEEYPLLRAIQFSIWDW